MSRPDEMSFLHGRECGGPQNSKCRDYVWNYPIDGSKGTQILRLSVPVFHLSLFLYLCILCCGR